MLQQRCQPQPSQQGRIARLFERTLQKLGKPGENINDSMLELRTMRSGVTIAFFTSKVMRDYFYCGWVQLKRCLPHDYKHTIPGGYGLVQMIYERLRQQFCGINVFTIGCLPEAGVFTKNSPGQGGDLHIPNGLPLLQRHRTPYLVTKEAGFVYICFWQNCWPANLYGIVILPRKKTR